MGGRKMVATLVRELKNPNTDLWQWIRTVAALVVIPLAVWGISLERRVTAIEANRFTAGDALAVYQELALKANKVDVPPPEVQKAIELLNSHIQWHLNGND